VTDARREVEVRDELLEGADATLLDVVDNLLTRGVVLRGDVVLGIAGVDLVYLELQLLLCAADRLLPRSDDRGPPEKRAP
jgi:hypothetical protein